MIRLCGGCGGAGTSPREISCFWLLFGYNRLRIYMKWSRLLIWDHSTISLNSFCIIIWPHDAKHNEVIPSKHLLLQEHIAVQIFNIWLYTSMFFSSRKTIFSWRIAGFFLKLFFCSLLVLMLDIKNIIQSGLCHWIACDTKCYMKNNPGIKDYLVGCLYNMYNMMMWKLTIM